MKYPKIDTLWKRDKQGKIIEREYSKEEFSNIKRWEATEKIDGMNIRIHFSRNREIYFYGRTDNAQIPEELAETLKKTFTYERFKESFDEDVEEVWLFGEGYGQKIQNGGAYDEHQQFILFDVVVDGTWLERASVDNIAQKFFVKAVPIIGTYEEFPITGFIKIISKQNKISIVNNSMIAKQPKEIEGVVCRTAPLMFDRRGNPIMMKLKIKDYRQ